MLEFTATVDRIHPEIKKKYEDKTIYRYDLKQFRLDKFSKEVKTLQADVTPLQRMLQAIILSHYRRKIAEKNHI
jgi:type III restriction enzyme